MTAVAAGVQSGGPTGLAADGTPATGARFGGGLRGLASDAAGNLYFGDTDPAVIWKVGPDGVLQRFAGSGVAGTSGDGGDALSARIDTVRFLTVGPDGSLYLSTHNGGNSTPSTVRQVDARGKIHRIAGTGATGFSGDNQPASESKLFQPNGIATDPDGNLYVTDSVNQRVRRVGQALPDGFQQSDILIPSADGSEVYRFSDQGRHLSTVDALTGGVRYEFGYDDEGLLHEVRDAGNVTTIEHDGAGRPTAIVSPYGQQTTLDVDANGYLSTVAQPGGPTDVFTYSADGLMLSRTDPRQKVYEFEHDARGRLVRDDDPAGGHQALSRTDDGDAYEVTRQTAEGRSTRYRVERQADGSERRVVTRPDGTASERTTQRSGSWTATEASGEAESAVVAGDPRFGMQSPITKTRTITTPGGRTMTVSRSRGLSLSNPDDLLSVASLVDATTVNGKTWTTIYDGATRTSTTTSPANRKHYLTLDSVGRPASSRIDGLAAASYGYDARGRLASITSGSGAAARTIGLGYGTHGFLETLTDPLTRSTAYGYDASMRVSSITRPDTRALVLEHDASGNLTKLEPPADGTATEHGFSYTAVDLTSAYTPPVLPGTGPTQYAYDLDRALEVVTRPDGKTITLGHDAAGRLATRTVDPGSQITTYAYAPTTGLLSTITADDGVTLSYAYDASLPTGETWSGTVAGSIVRTFDDDFRVATLSVNGQATSYGYDADGLLTAAGALTLTRHAQHGLVTATTLGTISDSHAYDGFGAVSEYEAKAGSTPLFTVGYQRDRLGRIVEKTESTGGSTKIYEYGYDTVGRLETVTEDGVLSTTYAYDPNGNRASKESGPTTESATYDAQDRLLTYGDATYTYGPNGELATKTDGSGTTSYGYDALGSLRSVTLPNGTAIEYVIDGRGRRIGKKVNGTLVQGFLYDGQVRVVAELDGAGSLVSRFVYGTKAHAPDFIVKGGVTYRIVSDHLGSPRLVIDASTGNVLQEMRYDEFGVVLSDTNPGFQPFGFAGGLYDQHTKLVRFGARDYDADTGRWTAKDPILFRGGDGNLYGYVRNDPVDLVDSIGTGPAAAAVVTRACTAVAAYTAASTLAQLRELAEHIAFVRNQIERLNHECPADSDPGEVLQLKRELEETAFRLSQDYLTTAAPGVIKEIATALVCIPGVAFVAALPTP